MARRPRRKGWPVRLLTPRSRWHATLLAFAALTLCIGACSMLRRDWDGPATMDTEASLTPGVRDASPWSVHSVTRLRREPDIRVRLAGAMNTVRIGGPRDVMAIPMGSPSGIQLMRTPITATIADGLIRVADASGTAHTFAAPADAEGAPGTPAVKIEAVGGGPLNFDNAQLPGALVLHVREDGRGMDVVEHLPLETYVAGVIAKELYASWALETFKAQAIAARSYAVHELLRRRAQGRHFDVLSTTADQVYAGLTENSTALRAAQETRGRVLAYRGEVLRAYYSSTTGGRAASAADTWPTDGEYVFNLVRPIQASPRNDADSFSPLYRWRVERDVVDLSTRMLGFIAANNIAPAGSTSDAATREALVESIAVAQRNPFGRPRSFTITDAAGRTWTLSAEQIRLASNFAGVQGVSPVTREQRINSGDFEATRVGRAMVFMGQGFGHGVGMSQFGAEGMARQGVDAPAILGHYYPGATIVSLY